MRRKGKFLHDLVPGDVIHIARKSSSALLVSSNSQALWEERAASIDGYGAMKVKSLIVLAMTVGTPSEEALGASLVAGLSARAAMRIFTVAEVVIQKLRLPT